MRKITTRRIVIAEREDIMRKKERSRIAVLLGIGAICGMLGTTGRYVYAENMTTATAAIEESTGDITPATGYEVSENAGPELYTSDEELALQSTSNDTSQSGTWENVTWTLSGTTLRYQEKEICRTPVLLIRHHGIL